MIMGQQLIDISSWQHTSGAVIDWANVAASGVAGVIIKVTQGANYANPYFADDLAGAQAAGLLVGAYHFAEPASSTAEAEAEWCNAHVMGLDLPLGLWLDLEVMSANGAYETQTWAQQWVGAVAVATRKTGIYLNQSFLDQMPALVPALPLWFATGGTETAPAAAIIVQGTPGAVPGIEGDVDHDTLVSSRWVNPTGPNPPEVDDMTQEEMLATLALFFVPQAGEGAPEHTAEGYGRLVAAGNESLKESGVAPSDKPPTA